MFDHPDDHPTPARFPSKGHERQPCALKAHGEAQQVSHKKKQATGEASHFGLEPRAVLLCASCEEALSGGLPKGPSQRLSGTEQIAVIREAKVKPHPM